MNRPANHVNRAAELRARPKSPPPSLSLPKSRPQLTWSPCVSRTPTTSTSPRRPVPGLKRRPVLFFAYPAREQRSHPASAELQPRQPRHGALRPDQNAAPSSSLPTPPASSAATPRQRNSNHVNLAAAPCARTKTPPPSLSLPTRPRPAQTPRVSRTLGTEARVVQAPR